ncbi:Phthalate 4,5-dioxygenase oxygenase reductase subunit [Cupriavidus yeoncheonensis]|uniref:Phthalate 4,5-dioxygenase oxygenase reductase subunit n=1 Tax=Cupriavidus yeoncheonensis TaxID=1462994 RepID=A0A916IXP4_9BURK|nr:PDR/VanB family oxidoreductase [Cupriavidus yeoncheonensis]CAG2150660.1 Phthalate 4,5-dioxygenase oxygenase reductase subunit [Cupriavidus yeoncheonensis]
MGEVMELMVTRIADEAERIRSFELAAADGDTLPAFTAGAHIDVHVAGGAVRQYSLLNDDRERHRYVIAVLREEAGRGVSRYLHERVQPGMRLTVGGPRNAFPLDGGQAPVVLVAGGIGVTPLLAMARHMHADGRPFTLHFATRSEGRTPFLRELRQAPFAAQVRFYHDDGPPAQRFDAAALTASLPRGAQVYLCGPSGFMDAVAAAVRCRADLVLHTEYFAAPAPSATRGGAFRLVLARSGIETMVPADSSIVDVLRQHGIEPTLSCEQGICGTCLTRVLCGQLDHRDHYLSASEQQSGDRMLVCVSRALPDSTLTLDL